jgi:cysteine synthase A
MRVDHPSDISLALQKVRKRNPDGLLRIQPALPGDVYRVVAFKAGAALLPVAYMEETVTPSVYRVPLGVTLPLPADSEAVAQMDDALTRLKGRLPEGWGYCEFEFVATEAGVVLTDMQAPVRLGREPRRVVLQALGVDLLRCALECALGRVPDVTPRRAQAVAFSWLLTRSGVVTEVTGVSAARALPGVVDVVIQAREGDVLTHVVDRASRERGGYILAEGDSLDRAWAALEQAREAVWIQTSPALS